MSSEHPVERYDWLTGERYLEVLDHGPGGPDLAYARDGLPFLLDHSHRTQVGLVTDVHLDEDRKLRGTPVPGNHPDAGWVFADIAGGIRKKVSVGYDPGRTYTQTETEGAIPTRVYRGWRIYEASTVAVPADYDVGVARSAFEGSARDTQGKPLSTSREAHQEHSMETQKETAPAAAGTAQVTRDYDAERKQRNVEIVNIEALAKRAGVEASAAEALAKDWTPAEFMAVVSERSISKATSAVPAGRVEMSDREQRQYSIVRAIHEIADAGLNRRPVERGIEQEVSDEIASKIGKKPNGFYVPLGLATDRERAAQVRAAVTGNIAATNSLGGLGVQTSVQSMIEILRNASVLRQAGIRALDGLSGNVLFPRQITANTWSWEGENPSTAKALSSATIDSFTLSPKTGYGATAYSKQLLLQASFSVEQFVREDLAAIAAIGIDLAGLHGLGTSNQPTGVFVLGSTGSVSFGTDGGAPTWAKIVEFETTSATANALQGNLAYISTPGARGKLKTTLKNTASGSEYLVGTSVDAGLNGYRAFYSNQVKTNFTAGTSTTICHGMVFGNWSEGMLATWGDALDITVDPYNYVTQGMIQVVECAMVDFGWRHPASFVVSSSLLTA